MNNEQEIRDLANKLLQSKVARSHMDAVEMAKSMIAIDLTPTGAKIDNLDAPNMTAHKLNPSLKDPSAPQNAPVTVDSPIDVSETLTELDQVEETIPEIKSEVLEEIREVELKPNDNSNIELIPTANPISEDIVKEEILEIETEPNTISVNAEREMDQEMEVPRIIQEEQSIDRAEPLHDVESEVIGIETEPDQTPLIDESKADDELAEPELLRVEQTIDSNEPLQAVEQEIVGVESAPDSFAEQELERELNPGEVRTTTGITAQTTDLEEYAAKKMAEQGAMSAPSSDVAPTPAESDVPSAAVLDKVTEEDVQKETFILSNVSKDELDKESSKDSDGDITNLF